MVAKDSRYCAQRILLLVSTGGPRHWAENADVHTLSPLHSSRVIQHKKGGSRWHIPFEITFIYRHQPPYEVINSQQVSPLPKSKTARFSELSVEQAIELYLEAFPDASVSLCAPSPNRILWYSVDGRFAFVFLS